MHLHHDPNTSTSMLASVSSEAVRGVKRPASGDSQPTSPRSTAPVVKPHCATIRRAIVRTYQYRRVMRRAVP